MLQLICHLVGDFLLQTHHMARLKSQSSRVCFVHALLYMLVFALVLWPSPLAMLVIAGTHFVIDRWQLASVYCRYVGVGYEGYLGYAGGWYCSRGYAKPIQMIRQDAVSPGGSAAPDYLRVWLVIVVDQTFHLTINYLALRYL